MATHDVVHHARGARTAPRRSPGSRLGLLALALLVCAAAALAAAVPANAVPGSAVWSKRYSASSLGDAFSSVARGPGGVVYATGITKATEEVSTLVLVKYRDDGATASQRWVRTYRWPGVIGSEGTKVAVDASGNVFVAGAIGYWPPASTVGRDILVVKYSSGGTLRWAKRYDGSAHRDDYTNDLAIDKNGHLRVLGTSRGSGTNRDYVLFKLRNSDGARLWTTRYATAGADYAEGLTLDSSNNAYITGWSNLGGLIKAATLKISPAGAKLWTKRIEAGAGQTYGNAIAVPSAGGGVYLGGNASGGMSTRQNVLVAKLSRATGDVLWSVLDDPVGGNDEQCLDLALDPAGNAAWVGMTTDGLGLSHGVTLRTDTSGGVTWRRVLLVDGPDNETNFQTVTVDNAGGVYSGGYATRLLPGVEFTVQHILANDTYGWTFFYGGNAAKTDICRDLALTSGAIYAAGLVETTTGGTDAYLVKIDR